MQRYKYFTRKVIIFPLLVLFFYSCRFPAVVETIDVSVDSVTIIFSGDLMQHIPQVSSAKTELGYDYTYCFSSIARLWQSADFTIVNLETTISETPPYSGYPMFCSPSEVLDATKMAGVDVFALANNHCCDKGSKGLYKTIQNIENKNFKYIGVSQLPDTSNFAVLVKNNLKIIILNYTYGTNGMPIPENFKVNLIDTLEMKYTLSKLRQDTLNKIIIYFHWGTEYSPTPDNLQVELVNWCLQNGADFVIGSHPHVVQPIDISNKVVYSLGNLVSNQSKRYQDGGISVKLTILKDTIKCQFIPHWVDRSDKYKILLPSDTLYNKSSIFLQSLNDNRKIIGGNVSELIL